ncbi:MAG: hypothetical protein KBF64_06220 [Anaerolineaceae bacterium]|nr:hypothetical protein [Anaerolineaceae bacterium]
MRDCQIAVRFIPVVNGKRVDAEDRLIVATSDLELSEGLNYLPIPEEKVNYDVSVILPEVLERYIRKHTPIRNISHGRIEIDLFH